MYAKDWPETASCRQNGEKPLILKAWTLRVLQWRVQCAYLLHARVDIYHESLTNSL